MSVLVTTVLHDREFEEPDRGSRMDAEHLKTVMREVIETLPQPHRQIILMRAIYSSTFREIAQSTGCCTTTASQRYQKGLRMLRHPTRIQRFYHINTKTNKIR